LPKGWFGRRAPRVAYAEITTMDEMRVSGQRFLAFSAAGKSYTISAIMLPKTMTLAELKQQITHRVAIARHGALR